MVNFTPTSRLSTHFETTREETTGRNVREDESWWCRSLAVIVLAEAFYLATFLLAAVARNSITMRNCTCMEWTRWNNLLNRGRWFWRRWCVDATCLQWVVSKIRCCLFKFFKMDPRHLLLNLTRHCCYLLICWTSYTHGKFGMILLWMPLWQWAEWCWSLLRRWK